MLAMVAGAAVAITMPAKAQRIGVDPPAAIVVDAKPIAAFSTRAPNQRRFGMVEYLGAEIFP